MASCRFSPALLKRWRANPMESSLRFYFRAVKEETSRDLVEEFRHSGPQYWLIKQTLMRNKFVSHYRRMLPMLLENVSFRSENRFQPVIEALAAIRRHVNKKGRKHRYFCGEGPD